MVTQEVVQRLLSAAARSGAHLICEAARATGGWAVLADPIAGAVYSTPSAAAAAGVRAALTPQEHPSCTIRPAAGAVLVLGASTSPPELTALVARTTAALLDVRAQRAAELRTEAVRLHTAVIRLLLAGRAAEATQIVGGAVFTHATVYRLTGPDIPTALQVLWRAIKPKFTPASGPVTLMGQLDAELVVLDLHQGTAETSPGDGRTLRLVSRVAERHSLLGGIDGPAPLAQVATAYSDAATARQSATANHRIAPVTGTGLTRILPPRLHAAWAAAALRPLTPDQRHVLAVWLRSGSAHKAAALLGVSAGTVRARLAAVGDLLATDLTDPTVQAHLLLALRAPESDSTSDSGEASPVCLRSLPAGLLDTAHARTWATSLVGALDTHLRIALRCWLHHRGRTAPAAAALRVHRTTLTQWLAHCADTLGLTLAHATVRAELLLAVELVATPTDVPTALPRRGGRTYHG